MTDKDKKKRFELFKKTCLQWQVKLGLTEYELFFSHTKLRNNYAEIAIDQLGKCVTLRLNSVCRKEEVKDVRYSARHEMFHLLLSRLVWLGRGRYVMYEDLTEADEAIARKLDHLFGDNYE